MMDPRVVARRQFLAGTLGVTANTALVYLLFVPGVILDQGGEALALALFAAVATGLLA